MGALDHEHTRIINDFACRWRGFLMAGTTPSDTPLTIEMDSVEYAASMVDPDHVHVIGVLDADAKKIYTQLRIGCVYGDLVISHTKSSCSFTMCFATVTQRVYITRRNFSTHMAIFEQFARSFGARWLAVDDIVQADANIQHQYPRNARIEGKDASDHLNVWEANGYCQPTLTQLQELSRSCAPVKEMIKTQKELEAELKQVMSSTSHKFKCGRSDLSELCNQLAQAATLHNACNILAYHMTSSPDEITKLEAHRIWMSDKRPAVLKKFNVKTILDDKIVYVKCFDAFDKDMKAKADKIKADKCETAASRLYDRM